MREAILKKTNAANLAALVFVAAVLTAAMPSWAAEQPSAEAVAAVEEHFRLLPMQEGWLLEPLDPELAIETIEVQGDSLAIDGQRVSTEELEARLGGLAAAVLALIEEAEHSDAASEDSASDATEARRQERAAERAERAERRAQKRKDRIHHDRSDAQVVVGNSLTVEEDDVYRDVLVFGGALAVDGQVIGDAVAIGGSAQVSGEITGNLAVIGGSIQLEDGARIMGDVVSVGGSIEYGEDVEVAGQIIEVPFGPNFNFGNFSNWGNWANWGNWGRSHDRWEAAHGARKWGRHARWFGFFEAGWELIGVLFCALLACLVFLVARNPVERIATKVSEEPWKAGLAGLLTQILCLPILVLVCLLLLISIIGIPLLLLIPFAILGFILVAFLGYTAVAYRLGDWCEDRFSWNLANPYFTLLLGIGLIEIWALTGEFLSLGPGPIKFFAAMFILFGCLLAYLAWTIGLGGAVLTRFGTWSDVGGLPPPPLPAPAGPDWDQPDRAADAAVPDESTGPNGQNEHL